MFTAQVFIQYHEGCCKATHSHHPNSRASLGSKADHFTLVGMVIGTFMPHTFLDLAFLTKQDM